MSAQPLDFALKFVDGRGVLGLGAQTLFDLVGIERLELTVPNLRFPFDASGGTARFQNRRCELGAAALRVEADKLQAWLDGRTRLGRLGLTQLKARLVPGRIELAARARMGDGTAVVTARVTLEPAGGQRLRARIGDVRLYGYLPAPAPLVGLGIAFGLGAEPNGAPHALSVQGTGEVLFNPLELLLWKTLPPAGWRLPRYQEAALLEARVDEGAIVLRYGAGTAAAVEPDLGDEETRAADALLARGDLLGAVEAWGRIARSWTGPEAAERQLAILAAMPARWPEAETLGARLVADFPERPQALHALAAIEAERGLSSTAAARYVKLAELAEAAGEKDDARAAALRAGELLARVSPREAIPWLEKTLAGARDDSEAATLLCAAYAADGRWQDLLRLERWRLTQTNDPVVEAEVRGRIARVWLDELHDPVRARDELERVLRGQEGEAKLWELYARTLEATGDGKRARESLGKAAALLEGGARAALELRASVLAEAEGDVEAALGHAHAALRAASTDLAALERTAELLARLGRLDDAVAAYQDAIERAEETHDDPTRANLLVALARLAREALHDQHGARAYVERALAIVPSTAALQLAVELAEEDGRLDDLERLCSQLADGGDRRAKLRQAEVLARLERYEEAAAAAEEVSNSFPAAAAAVMAQAYAALGRGGDLRAALERLAAVGGDPSARLRLAELRSADGDLDGARALLEELIGETLRDVDERRAVELITDVLMRQGDDRGLEAALGKLAELRDDDPGRARALAAQGAARARLSRMSDALESYRRALAISPPDDDVQARVGLGEVAYALKLWDEARAALEPLFARGLQPRGERALRLGEIAERQGRADEAVPFYQAALTAGAHAADAVRAHNALAGIFHSLGDFHAEAEAQLRAADDPSTNEPDTVRAGRLVVAAEIWRKRAGRRQEALAGYERALGLDPLQITALDALEALAAEAQDLEGVAQVLGRKVAATAKRPTEQKAILGRLAALQAELGRPDAARAAYARALELDAAFRPALTWLAGDARARGATEDERAALEKLTALAADPVEPEAAAPTLARLAELYAATGMREEAERTARKALALAPRERIALAVIDQALAARGGSRELAELLAVRAEVETDFDVIVELLFRRAALLESLGELRAAVHAYEQLIALRPSSAAAWNRLAALLRNGNEWQPLAQLLTRLAERHAADGRRGEAEALYVEIAHLAHDRLNDPERARAVLHKALEVEPKSRVALQSLLALARGRGDAAEEDLLLGRLAELTEDGAARSLAVAERARARHARGDLDGALALLRDLVPTTAPDAALKLRAEIEEARGTLAQAAPALEELRARAAAAHDESSERWATRRLLRVAAAHRSSSSEELARRALELDPDDRDAALVLIDLERARGNAAGQLAALERLLRIARRTFEGPAREAELGIEVATVLAKAGDSDAALARLREVIEVAPDVGAAHRAYGTLLSSRGQPAEAARALTRAAELGTLDGNGWVLLAGTWEALGDGERAAAAYHRAGAAAPPKKRAEAAFRAGRASEARAAAIEALAQDARDAESLAWAMNGLSPAAILALADELAPRLAVEDGAWLFATVAGDLPPGSDEERLALERAATLSPTAEVLVALGDRMHGPEAAARYESALALDPAYVGAALGLAREGDPYGAARALQAAWERIDDPRRRAQISAARASLLRDRLGDLAGARAAVERALSESEPFPDLAPLRSDLLRAQAALLRAGDPRAAEAALERLREEGGATPADLRHLAELYAERGAFQEVVTLLWKLPGSSETLERALEATGRLDELAARLADEAVRKPPAEARGMYLRAAQLAADRLADPARAAMLLERALPLGPADAEVWARLGRLYLGPLADPDRGARCLARAFAADRERADLLLPLADFHHDAGEHEPATDYYREALARFAVPADEAARVHLRLAEHAHERGDSIDEEQSLLQAVQLGADQAWPRLAELHRARGDGAKLAEVLLKQAEQATGLERATLLREAVPHLSELEGTRLDEQILLLDPSDEAARDRVLSRLRAGGDAAALMARLERELPRASMERQAAYARELGRLASRIGDEERAESAWTTSLGAAPSLEAARALWELYGRHGRHADAAPLFEAALEDPRLDPSERDELARLAGEAYLSSGADAGRALAFVERARAAGMPMPLDPARLRQLLRAERRFLDLVVAIDAQVTQTSDPAERLALELEAAETLERDLGHAGDAARRYAALFDREPEQRELAARARIAYGAAAEPIYALAVLEREIKLVADGPATPQTQIELSQLKIVKGELLLQAGADAEAEAEFLHALITTPRVGRAHAALADVYKKRGDLAGALEHLIAAADAPDLEPMRAAACAVDAADVLLVEGDSVTAERLYQLAAALDPADRRPVDALARLAAARGDSERHADLLGRAAALTADRRERARLALQRARLFQNELKRELDAYRSYKEAVACDPNLREAARGLREMAEARGEWALAAEQRYRELALTTDAAERARLHIEMAHLLEDKILDGAAALRNFEQAAELVLDAGAPAADAPWADLVRLYAEAQRWRDAALSAERLAATLTGVDQAAARAEALSRAGELHEHAGDHERARQRLAEAAAIGGEAGRKADDSLLRIAEDEGDPEELRRRLEERLAVEPEGEVRLELLRRVLSLAVRVGDSAEIDVRSQELLARAPDDAEAFIARKHILETRRDAAGLAQLLRARAAAISDHAERAERRFEAGRIAETELYDVAAAASDYEAALIAEPEHTTALDALADLSYRTRHVSRARALYSALGDRPSSLGADEVSRRRAELAEEAGDLEEARAFYEQAVLHNGSNLSAHQALARLAIGRSDDLGAFQALRAVLDLLPLDAVERITELRRHLGELAFKLGDRDAARNYLELVLSQLPMEARALELLARIYMEQEEWQASADALARLSRLVREPAERAELLFRRGELLRLGMGDLESANDAYLKAADLHPTHAPTLRRLVAYYYSEGDFVALKDVARDLEQLGQPLEEAAIEAGLGLALGGDEARGTVVVAVARPTAPRLAELLAAAKILSIGQIDPALRASARALGPEGRGNLQIALETILGDPTGPLVAGARLALARLHDAAGDIARARVHYAVGTFVEPASLAAIRLRELGPPEPITLPPEAIVHPDAIGPLHDAMAALAPLLMGLAPSEIDADPAPAWTDKLRAVVERATGSRELEAAVVVDLRDPAWAEPTRPPRLLLARRTLADEGVARFAAARAMYALYAGVPLVEGRPPDDVAALLRAAAALFLPDLRAPDRGVAFAAFVRAWQAELAQLQLDPERLPEPARARLEVVLAAAVVDSRAAAAAADWIRAERLSADRAALAATGDLRAALTALAPSEGTGVAERAALLTTSPLGDLVAFALALT
ncbi:MAG: Tetratricopeptide 4 [Myxococcales bacterium]|nr:Tetratricopeptide 4 [Myxococcales bacterium]